MHVHDTTINTTHLPCPDSCKGRLQLFRAQPLSALAVGSVQTQSEDTWIDAVAELRGMQVVFYTPSSYNENVHFGSADLVAVLLLHHYRIDVVKRGVVRVYFTPNCGKCGVVAYVQPLSYEVDEWRYALGRVRASKMVTPADLKVFSRIGVGGYGKVYVASYRKGAKFSDVTSEYSDSASDVVMQDISEGDVFALKVIPKKTVLESCTAFRLFSAERLILERGDESPYLLSLSFAFQTREHVFLGTPLCAGGDLAAYLNRIPAPTTRFRKWHTKCCGGFMDRPRLAEEEVARIGAQLIVALQTLHSWRVLYRDLKPENVLLDAKGNCILADFGLSRIMLPGEEGEMTVCGTETCMAPETRLARGGFAADVWSLGATLYKLLTGRAPFPRGGPTESNPLPVFPCFVSRPARGLLRGMLAFDAEERAVLEGLRKHKFFKRIVWEDVEEGEMVALPQIPRLLRQGRMFGGAKMAMSARMWRGLNGVPVADDGCWDGREARARDADTVPGLEYAVPVGRFRRVPVFGERNWVRGFCGVLPEEVRLFLYS